MTTNKNSHEKCFHPKTKAARSKCRKERAAWAAEEAKWAAERAEMEKDRAAERDWNEEFPKFAASHQDSAHQNADDTAHEEGFEMYSRRWYQVALSSLHSARDNSMEAHLYDNDPEPGSYIRWDNDYRWVDGVSYFAEGGAEVHLITRDGIRSTHKIADLIAKREAEENG